MTILRSALVAACSAAMLVAQAGPAWAQASHWEGPGGGAPSLNYQGPQGPYPGLAAARQQMSQSAAEELGWWRAALRNEEFARGQYQRERCYNPRIANTNPCPYLLDRVRDAIARREQMERRVQAAGGVQRLRAAALAAPTARRDANQASPGGIDPASAALLGAVAGGLIGFGVTRGARGHVPQMGRSNRPMPVHPRGPRRH